MSTPGTAQQSRRVPAGGIASAAGLIAGVTVLSRVAGFARWVAFSGAVGGTLTGTAYSTANLLPNVLYEVAAGGALAAVVVPLVSTALAAGDPRRADRIGSALLTWAVTVLVPLAALLGALAPRVADVLVGPGTPGCPGAGATTAHLVRWFAPQIPLYGIGIVLAGLLQARRRFAARKSSM